MDRVNSKLSSVSENLKRFSINIDLLDISNKFSYKDFVRSYYLLSNKGLNKLGKSISARVQKFCAKRSTNLKFINVNATACSQLSADPIATNKTVVTSVINPQIPPDPSDSNVSIPNHDNFL